MIVISGKYLTKPLNGIPRYANEVIKHLDRYMAGKSAVLYVPQDVPAEKLPALQNIKIVQVGKAIKGWDNLYPEKFARKNNALYINLCSQGVLYKNSIVCLHDIRPMTWDKKHGVKLKRTWTYTLKCRAIAKNAKQIVTGAEACREEIACCLDVDGKHIVVIPCGWEHINKIEVDKNIFAKFKDIKARKYYFSIGSIAPHKNFKWVLAMAKKYPEERFVISGGIDKSIWKDEIDFSTSKNVIFTGYVSDEEMKALMANAKALLFPSFYEGFGIPPLEALALGVPVFCSDIPVLKEIYGASVRYFDPYDTNIDLDMLWSKPVASAELVLQKYTWENAAKAWAGLISEQLQK